MKKILLVDDEVDFTSIFRQRLSASHFEVIVANSGNEGISKAISEKPDLIILDINMPDRDGLHVYKDIKENESIKDIPIIMISGIADQEEIATTMLNMGIRAEEILVKPFEADLLIKKINKIIHIKQKQK